MPQPIVEVHRVGNHHSYQTIQSKRRHRPGGPEPSDDRDGNSFLHKKRNIQQSTPPPPPPPKPVQTQNNGEPDAILVMDDSNDDDDDDDDNHHHQIKMQPESKSQQHPRETESSFPNERQHFFDEKKKNQRPNRRKNQRRAEQQQQQEIADTREDLEIKMRNKKTKQKKRQAESEAQNKKRDFFDGAKHNIESKPLESQSFDKKKTHDDTIQDTTLLSSSSSPHRPGGPEPSGRAKKNYNEKLDIKNKTTRRQPRGPEPPSSSASMKPHRLRTYAARNYSQDDDSGGVSFSDDEDDDDDDSDIFPGAMNIGGTNQQERSNYTSFLVQEYDQTTLSSVQSPNNKPGLPTIEAEIVDPTIEEGRVRMELLKQLKATAPAATVVDHKDDSCWNGRRWKILVPSFLLVIIATAILTVLLTRDNGDNLGSLVTDAPSQIPSMMPTMSPQPTGFPTAMPSPAPTTFWNQVGESQVLRQSLEGLEESDQFGREMAFSANGEIFAVGASRFDFQDNFDSGQVTVFQRDDSSTTEPWVQLGQNVGGDAPDDRFGFSVALSRNGTVVAVGGNRSDPNGLSFAGRVKVFSLSFNGDNGTPLWVPLGSPIDGTATGTEFGLSASLSSDGRILAIGTAVGEVIVFRYEDNQWLQHGRKLTGGPGNTYVDLSGDGTVLAEGSIGGEFGRVRVHKYIEEKDEWLIRGSVIFGLDGDDEFGRSVSLSEDGNILAVGAWRHNKVSDDGSFLQSAGHVRVFRYDETGNSWNPLGQILEGEEAADFFGISVSLSDDGRVLGVGATQQHAAGNPPGYAIAYRLSDDDTTWIPLGDRQIGNFQDDDFGYDVRLSGDGHLFAVGAPQFRTAGDADRIHLGYVRVLEIATAQMS